MKTTLLPVSRVRFWMWILLLALGLHAEDLQKLRQNQQADLDRLLEYYDGKAVKDCPKLGNGKVDTSSSEYKKLLNDYKRAHEKLNDAYRKKDSRLSDVKAETPGTKSSASEALTSASSAALKAKADAAEAQAKAEAEAQAKAEAATAKAEADAKKAKAEADAAKAKADADAAKASADAADAKAKAHATEAKLKAEAEMKAKAKVDEAKAKAEAAKSKANAETAKVKAAAEAEAKAKAEAADAKANAQSAEAKAKAEAAEATAKKNAEMNAKTEAAQAKAKANAAEAKAKVEAEMKAKADAAAAKAKAEAAALSSKADPEVKAKADAAAAKAEANAAKAKANAEAAAAKAKADLADAKAKAEAEMKAKADATEAKAKADAAEAKAQAEATAAKTKADAEAKAKSATAEAKAKADAAEANAKAEAEAKTKADAAEAKAKADAVEAKAKADAAEVKAKTDAVEAKVKADAEVKAKAKAAEIKAKVDTPHTKAPNGPDVKVDTPNVGKTGGQRVIKVIGDGINGIDGLSTAEDAKQDFLKGEYGEGGKKIGEAIADEATMGAYSGAKTMKQKKEDVDEAGNDIDLTNKNLREQHDQNLRVKLHKAGMSIDEINKIKTTDGLEHAVRKQGLEVPDAPTEVSYVDKGDKGAEIVKKQISEEYCGNMRDQLVKSGKMTREEADKIKTEEGLAHAMNKHDLKVPEKPESGFIEVDDSMDDRIADVGDGVVKTAEKAKKFVKEAAKDTSEIGMGLTDKNVRDQVYENTKDNVKGWLQTWEEERNSEGFTGDSKEGMEEYLIKRGASPVGAKKAADDYYEKGDTKALENLDDTLRYKDAVAEAKRRGEEIPSKEEFDKISNSLKARKERAKAERERDKDLKESEAADQEEWSEDKDLESEHGGLENYTQKNSEKRQKETGESYEGMEIKSEMETAAHAGDDDRRQAKIERNQAGEDARDTENESNRVVKDGDQENSWGKQIGDAIEDGMVTGAKTLGQEFGNAAAEKAIDEMWEPEKPKIEPPAGSAAVPSAEGEMPSAAGQISVPTGESPEGGPQIAGPEAGAPPLPGDIQNPDLPTIPEVTEEPGPLITLPESTIAKTPVDSPGSRGNCQFCGRAVVLLYNDARQNAWGCPMGCYKVDGVIHSKDPKIDTTAKNETNTPGGDYPPGMKPCIRCGAVKKIPKQESLCLSCVTKVMMSYGNYIQTGNDRGDGEYFGYLSSGTKAQIERNNSR
jgi:hypothetical protein